MEQEFIDEFKPLIAILGRYNGQMVANFKQQDVAIATFPTDVAITSEFMLRAHLALMSFYLAKLDDVDQLKFLTVLKNHYEVALENWEDVSNYLIDPEGEDFKIKISDDNS